MCRNSHCSAESKQKNVSLRPECQTACNKHAQCTFHNIVQQTIKRKFSSFNPNAKLHVSTMRRNSPCIRRTKEGSIHLRPKANLHITNMHNTPSLTLFNKSWEENYPSLTQMLNCIHQPCTVHRKSFVECNFDDLSEELFNKHVSPMCSKLKLYLSSCLKNFFFTGVQFEYK